MAAGFRSPSPPPLLPLLVLVYNCLLMLLPVASRGDYSCPNSESELCGRVNISYPFWLYNESNQSSPYCGYRGFMLTCQRDPDIPILHLGEHNYRVLHNIDYTEKVVTLAYDDIFTPSQEFCPRALHNATWPSDVSLSYAYPHNNLTFFFNCNTSDSRWSDNRICPFDRGINYSYVFQEIPNEFEALTNCSEVVVWPVLQPSVGNDLVEEYARLLQEGFKLHWAGDINGNCSYCERLGGRCGYNETNDPVCFWSGGEIEDSQRARRKNRTALIIGIVIGALVAVGLLCASILFCRYKKKRNYLTASKTITSSASSGPSSMDPEKYSVHFQTNLFSYDELQEATNGFDKELGDGGFGTVFKGKLRDGRVVAVKRLYENNCRRLEQFMNEIEILSCVRHQNLVDLYGWTSRDSKELLLVYEFVPNGTVADHLHGSRAREGILTWPMRLKIAIEAAEALAYLHAIDPPIIHRDIKTSNILLDSSFHVKVADFGLSRWFPTDATHVSTVPQGTPGYLDPEYHECYHLTHKSDVYSFGVVLIELLSSKPAVDFTRHRKEINLANMALNRIQNGELDQLVDGYLGYQSNQAARKTVTMVAEVAFRCLQVDGDMRPPMKEVLEALIAIQNEGHKVSNGGKEAGDTEDDAGLLKNIAPMSPDTVMNQWVSSTTTTPNTSEN